MKKYLEIPAFVVAGVALFVFEGSVPSRHLWTLTPTTSLLWFVVALVCGCFAILSFSQRMQVRSAERFAQAPKCPCCGQEWPESNSERKGVSS
jgi:uncharacterized membrane protein SpoIIM required for sporulation